METVELNNGIFMPMVGYGTYQTAPAVTTKNVLRALRTGYQLIDTAHYYGNEAEVGEALTVRPGFCDDEGADQWLCGNQAGP